MQQRPAIANFKRLRSLSIRFGKFTTVEPILKAISLTHLKLDNVDLRVEEVEKLAGLINLRSLTLSSVGKDPTFLFGNQQPESLNLAPFQQLTTLCLKSPHWQSCTGLLTLTNLQSLKLRNTKKAHVQGLASLTWLQSLDTHSSIWNNSNLQEWMPELKQIVLKLTQLRALRIGFLPPQEIKLFATALKNLTSLDLSCNNEPVEGYTNIANFMPLSNLKTLTVPVQLFTKAQFSALQKALPKLQVIADTNKGLLDFRTSTNKK